MSTQLASERVIISAPMSFVGSAQRSARLARKMAFEPRWLSLLLVWAAVGTLLLVWWAAIIVWYVVFGLFLLPYRMLRRGARKRKKQALQHRELLSAIERKSDGMAP